LDETVATDTFYANATAHDGSTCAQIYVGLKSYFTTCMGMQIDAQFPETLLDFIWTFGAMPKLYSDNAKAEISHAVKTVFVFITFLLLRVSLITRTKTLLNAASRN
jgi:hypothetical protein